VYLPLLLVYTKIQRVKFHSFSERHLRGRVILNKPSSLVLVQRGSKCRYFSTSLRRPNETAKVSPRKPQLYDSYMDITSEVINNLLVNQGVSITSEDLEKLKNIPSVKFDLPISDKIYPSFGTPSPFSSFHAKYTSVTLHIL